ncbi:MAG TPA: polysaccharide deacetylase family protein [Acidimicrobiales bacterium]|nr:polysaccharide deacetylase family protein [Acidimicrobiales bacterium]
MSAPAESVRPRHGRRAVVIGAIAVAAAMVAATAGYALWQGANRPDAAWFGSIVAHGPRDRPEVALTFDDGPDDPATLEIRDLLAARGLEAVFFSIGRAVDERPDITKALVASGQIVGNHSYRHDEIRWLDPRYPELGRAEAAIGRATGECPTFFRPPHGQHTPFMARVVARAHMKMIGWDVSAADWVTHDPRVVAARVLRRVRPGSIIDLHDGLDANVTADRSVVVRALPLILDGLAERHLTPVRLDRMLGVNPYAGRCPAATR